MVWSWFKVRRIISGFFCGRARLGPGRLPLIHELAQLFLLLIVLHLLLQLRHPVLQGLLLRVGLALGTSRGLILQGLQQRLQGTLLPLVVLLAGDAQPLRRGRRRHLTGADLEDQFRSLPGFGVHLSRFCRLGWRVGNLVLLDLFQPAGEFGQRAGALLPLQEGLQPWAQSFALGQVDPALQSLEQALHRPALPVVEGHPVDVELPAHIHRFASFGPHRQHRLGFVRRTERRGRQLLFLFLFVVGRHGFG